MRKGEGVVALRPPAAGGRKATTSVTTQHPPRTATGEMRRCAAATLRAAAACVLVADAVLGGETSPDIQRSDQPFLEAQVEEVHANVLPGGSHNTYRLSVKTANSPTGAIVDTIYAIYGDTDHPLVMPAAHQEPLPFGANIGGTNPAFLTASPNSAYDSWLTIGMTEGNVHNDLASIGIPWDDWTESQGLSVDDGAVFYMNPGDGPSFMGQDAGIVIAQLTLSTPGTTLHAQVGAQGRSLNDAPDWDQPVLIFNIQSASPSPSPSLPPTDANGQHDGPSHSAPQCSELQQSILDRCLDDCDSCQAHLHAYLTVVADCVTRVTQSNVSPQGEPASDAMQTQCATAAVQPPAPPPPNPLGPPPPPPPSPVSPPHPVVPP
eukprot:SAG31_NODE_7818_length_1590_cov_1.079812_1_plen_376_part_10